jgi:hypothetical protein
MPVICFVSLLTLRYRCLSFWSSVLKMGSDWKRRHPSEKMSGSFDLNTCGARQMWGKLEFEKALCRN